MEQNILLSRIPAAERQQLLARSDSVVLPRPRVLFEPEDEVPFAYFPTGGLVSLLAVGEDGDMMEVAAVSREGFLGLPILLHTGVTPYQAVVRVTGMAVRVRSEILRQEVHRSTSLKAILLRYTHDFVTAICARVVCQRQHTPLQRLSAWLLTVRRAVGADTFSLTHESIAQTLALQRTIVTQAAVQLQDAGAISYRHGRVRVRDRRLLAARACGCPFLADGPVDPAAPSLANGSCTALRETRTSSSENT